MSVVCRSDQALNIYDAKVKIFLVNYFIRNVCRIKSLLAFWEIAKAFCCFADVGAQIRDEGAVEKI